MCQIYDATWPWVIVAAVLIAGIGAILRAVHSRRWSYDPAAGGPLPPADARAAANHGAALLHAGTSVLLAAAALFLVGGGLECMGSTGDLSVMPG
jgi:hypothetical protein